MEIKLSPSPELLAAMETFAAHHQLPLDNLSPLPGAIQEQLTLTACHLAPVKLFVYCEKSILTAQAAPEGKLVLTVQGEFLSRKIPCQDTDLVLHLERDVSSRLLSYCFSIVRQEAAIHSRPEEEA